MVEEVHEWGPSISLVNNPDMDETLVSVKMILCHYHIALVLSLVLSEYPPRQSVAIRPPSKCKSIVPATTTLPI